MMFTAVSQSSHRAALLEANRAIIARIRDAVSGVTPEAIAHRPANGGWSIAEVLEHLIVSADSYLESISELMAQRSGDRVDAQAIWKPSFGGGLLASSLRNPRKLPSPKRYKPGPSPRPRALDEFLQRQEKVGRLIVETGEMDWRRVRMRSPVAPLLRMNLGDALTVLVVHAERHAAQIERVKAAVATESTQAFAGQA